MKIKLVKIYSIGASMDKLLARDLPIKQSYWLGKNASKIAIELKEVEKVRNDLIKKFGIENDNKMWSVPKDKQEEFFKSFNEVLEEEIEIGLTPISIKELGDIKLSGQEVADLEFMLTE